MAIVCGCRSNGERFDPNRHGEAFDQGETFAGVDLETGVEAVRELEKICPEGMTMAQFALRWILSFDAVRCVIPGAKRPAQVEENVAAADVPPLSEETIGAAREVYERHVRDQVHHRW